MYFAQVGGDGRAIEVHDERVIVQEPTNWPVDDSSSGNNTESNNSNNNSAVKTGVGIGAGAGGGTVDASVENKNKDPYKKKENYRPIRSTSFTKSTTKQVLKGAGKIGVSGFGIGTLVDHYYFGDSWGHAVTNNVAVGALSIGLAALLMANPIGLGVITAGATAGGIASASHFAFQGITGNRASDYVPWLD